MTRRIGIYSGTFDPVHAGHIAFAQEALKACELDEVVFLPEARPRGKKNVTGISHRAALLEKAIGNMSHFQVVQLASSQFTVRKTLPELRMLFKNADLTLLVGSDVAASLPHWPDADILLNEVSLAVGLRAEDDGNVIKAMLGSAVIVTTGHSHVTSSQARSGSGGFFNPAVEAYVSENALYAN